MAEQQPAVLPSEVFAAIAEAKRRNPKDTHGDGAFLIDVATMKSNSMENVRYAQYKILRFDPKKKDWAFTPVQLRFKNLKQVNRIYPPNDPKTPKGKPPGARIQFKHDAEFEMNINGRPVKQEYGKAKIAICQAFVRIANQMVKDEKIFNDNKETKPPLQTHRIVDKTTKKRELLKEPIIRMEIPFYKEPGAQSALPTATPLRCVILDVTKPRPAEANGRPANPPFEDAKFGELPLTFENIGKWMQPGSVHSGVNCMDSVTLSQQGIGLPSKARLLMTKASNGMGVDVNDNFDADDLADIMGAVAVAPAEVAEDPDDGSSTAGAAAAAAKIADDYSFE